MALELTNWQQVQDYLEKTPKLTFQITERNLKAEDETAKTILIQTTKNKIIKTLYKKKLKSGEELKDVEVNSYVVNLIQSYIGSVK